jgi:hypothetical protein
MDEGPIKSLLDILPAYLNFVIGFLRSPRAAFAPYALTGRVQSDLTSFLLAGVGAAYLAGAVMPITGFDIQNPRGAMDVFAGWLAHQDVKVLPLEALLLVLVLALGAHLVARLFDRWQAVGAKKSPDANLAGSTEDSVNAALGFAAIVLPLTTIVLLGVLALATPALERRIGQAALVVAIAAPLVLYMLVAIFYYLVMAFAAVHKVSWGRAAAALGTAFVCITVITFNIP